jgi:hypothetical protein
MSRDGPSSAILSAAAIPAFVKKDDFQAPQHEAT